MCCGNTRTALVEALERLYFSTHGDPHGSVVELWNRTLKTTMFCYFTEKNTLNYIEVLPALVKT